MNPLAAPAESAVVSGVSVVLGIAVALITALVLAEVLASVTRAVGRRTWLADSLARRARLPLRALLVAVLVWIALRVVTPGGADRPGWMPAVEHVLLIAVILTGAWLLGALLFVVEDATVRRYRTDTPDNRHARRVRTQVMVLRRLTVAVLVIAALAGALLTFEGARVAGAGLLASAGLLSVVAGLAAQTSLANVFAGLQLAFTDAIRVDDVVVVEDQWGRIEEITMTYVVVHVWDDRRLILPSTYFTTTPFENWTRRAADLLGTVELDLDWAVPVSEMRAELTRLLQASELWDHRVGVLQVTEATGGWVRVRALASAVDAPTLFDLRCAVREGLVAWLQREHPEALPRTRWEPVELPGARTGAADDTAAGDVAPARPGTATAGPLGAGTDEPAADAEADAAGQTRRQRRETEVLEAGKDARLFTGSVQAVARSRAFSGPGEDVIAEREHTAEGLAVPQTQPIARVSFREGPAPDAGPGRQPGADEARARLRRTGRDDETVVVPREEGPAGDA